MAAFSTSATLAASPERDVEFVPVDVERPWMVKPKSDEKTQSTGFGTRSRSQNAKPSFRPLSMLEVGALDESAQSDYFSDFRAAAVPNKNITLLGSVAGGLSGAKGGNLMGVIGPTTMPQAELLAQYELQSAAFGFAPPAPPVPGSFLPRATQGQRAPNAPGAR